MNLWYCKDLCTTRTFVYGDGVPILAEPWHGHTKNFRCKWQIVLGEGRHLARKISRAWRHSGSIPFDLRGESFSWGLCDCVGMNRLPSFHYNLVLVLQLRDIGDQFVWVAETCWQTVVCRPGRRLRAASTGLLTTTKQRLTRIWSVLGQHKYLPKLLNWLAPLHQKLWFVTPKSSWI